MAAQTPHHVPEFACELNPNYDVHKQPRNALQRRSLSKTAFGLNTW
jgi:hypothetical protein